MTTNSALTATAIISAARYLVSADFAESIALMRASSAISGRRLRVRFGHVVVGSEAGSGAYRICPPVWRSAFRHFHDCATLLPPCKLWSINHDWGE